MTGKFHHVPPDETGSAAQSAACADQFKINVRNVRPPRALTAGFSVRAGFRLQYCYQNSALTRQGLRKIAHSEPAVAMVRNRADGMTVHRRLARLPRVIGSPAGDRGRVPMPVRIP
jgi:hypothetical protein